MSIVVSRAYAHLAVAATAAAEAVVADEYYQPETERARARALAGAKDAADGFQKVSRSLRLTLMLQTVIAEAVNNPRPGVVREPSRAAGPSTTSISECDTKDGEGPSANLESARLERERREFDRPYPTGFEATVNGVVANIGATVDWATMTLRPDPLQYKPFVEKPLGYETRPPPEYGVQKAKRLMARDGRPPPPLHRSD